MEPEKSREPATMGDPGGGPRPASLLSGIRSFRPLLEMLPAAQQALWPSLRSLAGMGFVLYGGTAIALRLGHRESVDFDFFTERSFGHQSVLDALPFMQHARVIQAAPNTLTLDVTLPNHLSRPIKVSCFGGLTMGRVGAPEVTEDGVLAVASPLDLLATKLKVIFDRAEKKDYLDIHGLLSSGLRLEDGLASACAMYGGVFQPQDALRGLTYFKDGDLGELPLRVQKSLAEASARIESLPPMPQAHPVLGAGT